MTAPVKNKQETKFLNNDYGDCGTEYDEKEISQVFFVTCIYIVMATHYFMHYIVTLTSLVTIVTSSVVDPKLFITDPDLTFQ
jgi:hypothetical protein